MLQLTKQLGLDNITQKTNMKQDGCIQLLLETLEFEILPADLGAAGFMTPQPLINFGQ